MKTIPTLKMVLETYPKFAAIERMRMERPCEKTVESAVGGTRRLCEIGGLSERGKGARKKFFACISRAWASGFQPAENYVSLYAARPTSAAQERITT